MLKQHKNKVDINEDLRQPQKIFYDNDGISIIRKHNSYTAKIFTEIKANCCEIYLKTIWYFIKKCMKIRNILSTHNIYTIKTKVKGV